MSVRHLARNIVAADSAEELLAYNTRLEADANGRIQAWHWAITRGEYVCYTFEFAPDLVVYAQVLKAKPRHPYLFVRAYSVTVPTGEMGDVYRSVIEASVGREEFEAARARGWRAA